MAITKTGKSGGASGAIDYLLKMEKGAMKNPQMIGGNVATFGTKDDVKKDFDYYSQLKPNVKNQVVHLSVSLKPGEHLNEEKKVEFSEKLLEKLNFKTDCVPYLIVEHHDKEYEHWHILAGRIGDDGKAVKEWRIAERAISATKELEKEFGLEQVEYQNKSQRQIKRNEYKLIERTEELSVMAEAKIIIDESLREQPTIKSFVENLQRNGFEVRPNISEKSWRMSGFAFKKDEIVFKSSSLGKQYSFQNLQKNGLDYGWGRDAQYLIEVKQNELAQKPALEVGKNRRIKTTESLTSSQFIEGERAAASDGEIAGIANSNFQCTGQTESIVGGEEPIAERDGEKFLLIETAQSTDNGAQRRARKTLSDFGGPSMLDKGENSASLREAKTFDEPGSTISRLISATYASFNFTHPTDFDDYFDAQRIKDGNQENEIQSMDQSGLLDAGDGGTEPVANSIAQSQIYHNEISNSQLRRSQIGTPNSATETAGIRQGIEDFQINLESLSDVDVKPFDFLLTEQMTKVAIKCRQNDEDLDEHVSDSDKSKEDTLNLNIEFRMEEPQLIERRQIQIEERQEQREEYEINSDFRLSM